jgi:tetratricopeptide (TPR) repeat protein
MPPGSRPGYADTSAPDRTSADAALVLRADEHFRAREWLQATEAYREVVRSDPSHGLAWHQLGYSLHVAGLIEEALHCHIEAAGSDDKQIATLGAYNAACAFAIRGEQEAALDWLGRAIELGFLRLEVLRSDPDIETLRETDRFYDLLDQVEQRLSQGETSA